MGLLPSVVLDNPALRSPIVDLCRNGLRVGLPDRIGDDHLSAAGGNQLCRQLTQSTRTAYDQADGSGKFIAGDQWSDSAQGSLVHRGNSTTRTARAGPAPALYFDTYG